MGDFHYCSVVLFLDSLDQLCFGVAIQMEYHGGYTCGIWARNILAIVPTHSLYIILFVRFVGRRKVEKVEISCERAQGAVKMMRMEESTEFHLCSEKISLLIKMFMVQYFYIPFFMCCHLIRKS